MTTATLPSGAPPLSRGTEPLLDEVLRLGASDLHLDPGPAGYRARARVDGRFVPVGPPSIEGARLVNRIKVMASLLVYRSDLPQEGRMALPGGREGRVSLVPTPLGERLAVRIFDPRSELHGLGDLGFGEAASGWIARRLSESSGLVLVVGPAGSGKTTTLYALLREIAGLHGEFRQIVTVEDPVERHIPGCVQVEADASRDLDFASALKFLLRQDPEVLMVGEVRDAETARIAVRAAMTGHLVLSSLHCGRAADARPRLLEMGVEPYAVDLALRGALSQRLVRKSCPACTGKGCDGCLGSGFRGRTAVGEAAGPGEERTPTLEEAAAELVLAGVTTVEEIRRVLGGRP